MCGIVAIIDKNKKNNNKNKKDIKIMKNKILHRGPDNKNVFCFGKGIFSGFVRLAMLDKEKSNQPFKSDEGDIILLFNGEIYNYLKLKEELVSKGYKFKTQGDGEVILNLFKEYKRDCFKYLDGMFAVCIFDLKNDEIIIARDQNGIKPLYYCFDGDKIIISSELKAILPVKTKKEINQLALQLFLYLRFIPAPFCIVKDVYKVEPGEYIVLKNMKAEKYRFFRYNEEYLYLSNVDFKRKILKNIHQTFQADVPLGVFLSGGFDSTLISTVLSKNKNIFTFSIGYQNSPECDETNKVKNIIKFLKIDGDISQIKDNEVLGLVKKCCYYLDEPFYSTVSPSTLKLALQAKNKVKGVLTGDGSDELFFGYRYLLTALNNSSYKNYLKGLSWYKKENFEKIFMCKMLSQRKIEELLFKDCEMPTKAETLRRFEIFKRLPEYHLARVDRLTMACGIEARIPFLRKDVVNCALHISPEKLINNMDPKKIIKESFKTYLTNYSINYSKTPFTAPIKKWIEGPLKKDIISIFKNNKLFRILNINQSECLKVLNDYKGSYEDYSSIWGIYMMLKWAKNFYRYFK